MTMKRKTFNRVVETILLAGAAVFALLLAGVDLGLMVS